MIEGDIEEDRVVWRVRAGKIGRDGEAIGSCRVGWSRVWVAWVRAEGFPGETDEVRVEGHRGPMDRRPISGQEIMSGQTAGRSRHHVEPKICRRERFLVQFATRAKRLIKSSDVISACRAFINQILRTIGQSLRFSATLSKSESSVSLPNINRVLATGPRSGVKAKGRGQCCISFLDDLLLLEGPDKSGLVPTAPSMDGTRPVSLDGSCCLELDLPTEGTTRCQVSGWTKPPSRSGYAPASRRANMSLRGDQSDRTVP